VTQQVAEAERCFHDGQLSEAITALGDAVRKDPTDLRSRTFLFELLCFGGQLDRARKQLDAIASLDPELVLNVAWYQEAVNAEEMRQQMFLGGSLPEATDEAPTPSGTLNGKAFNDLRDADPRIGARIEVIAGGRYMWIPIQHLVRIETESPSRLRDLLWLPAQIEGTEELDSGLTEVLLPVMSPLAFRHPDERVRLGRMNEWEELDSGDEAPVGRKLLLVDGVEVSLLEVREVVVGSPDSPSDG
jgi:type VI secretion system protein ImpE